MADDDKPRCNLILFLKYLKILQRDPSFRCPSCPPSPKVCSKCLPKCFSPHPPPQLPPPTPTHPGLPRAFIRIIFCTAAAPAVLMFFSGVQSSLAAFAALSAVCSTSIPNAEGPRELSMMDRQRSRASSVRPRVCRAFIRCRCWLV